MKLVPNPLARHAGLEDEAASPSVELPGSMALLPTDRVDIGSHCLQLRGLQRCATERRHDPSRMFRSGHALSDRLLNSCNTAVAPQPCAPGQIGSHRAATAIRSVASATSAIGHLAVKDLLDAMLWSLPVPGIEASDVYVICRVAPMARPSARNLARIGSSQYLTAPQAIIVTNGANKHPTSNCTGPDGWLVWTKFA